jgi:hypothetical protein
MARSLAVAAAAVVLAASPARADRTLVFPLTASGMPADRAGVADAMTAALARSIGAAIGSVPIEDAAALLACDVESSTCLDGVSRSVAAERLVFGTIAPVGDADVAVTLTRFDRGPERVQRRFVVTGATDDELARALVDAAAPLFDREPAAGDPGPAAGPAEVGATVEVGREEVRDDRDDGERRGGRPSLATWILLGGGAAIAATGAGFLISADGLRERVADAPRETTEDFIRLNELEDRGASRARIGTALTIGGGVLLAIGAVRIVMEVRAPARRDRRGVRLQPVPVRGGAALVLTGELP